MKKLTKDDVQPIDDYEKRRPVFRQHIIELKQARRVALGPEISVVFENRDTALFQVQEMLRAERITDSDRIQEEIDTYNELVPDPGELRATLFIELPDSKNVAQDLPRFIGVEERVSLSFGGQTVKAEAEPGRSTEEKTSTIHYLRFPFSPAQISTFGQGSAKLEVAHENYQASTELSQQTVASLAADVRNGA